MDAGWIVLIVLGYVVLFLAAFVFGALFRFGILKIGALEVKWTDKLGRAMRDIPYGEREQEKVNVYLPHNKTDKLVVMIHGGGFTGGDRKDCEHNCASVVAKGYASCAPGYTTSNKEHLSSILLMSHQICDAIQKAYDTCKANGYPIKEIAVFGFSAGSCLALLYGYKYKDRWPCPVKFVFDGVGPTNFDAAVWGQNPNATMEDQANWAKVMFNCEYSAQEIADGKPLADLKEISACEYIAKDNPPTLMAYGLYDKLVPFYVLAKMKERLEEVQPVYDLLVFDKSGHGLQNNKEMSMELDRKINEYYDKYFTK